MGLLYLDEVAAATWTAGQNVMDGENFELDNWYRKVVRVGITGSSTIATAEGNFTLKYGERRVALLRLVGMRILVLVRLICSRLIVGWFVVRMSRLR